MAYSARVFNKSFKSDIVSILIAFVAPASHIFPAIIMMGKMWMSFG